MARILSLRPVELELDTDGLGSDVLAAAAFKIVEAYVTRLEASLSAGALPHCRHIIVRPVITEKLKQFLGTEGDLFRLEIEKAL